MKSQIIFSVIVPVLCLIFFPVEDAFAEPMGTAFTYQGRLIDANIPADGLYDFQFKLYNAEDEDGIQLGGDVNKPDVDVIDGYFTVELDFGSDVFDGNSVWLEIGVRPGDVNDTHTVLYPRQEVTPTPYALQTRGIFVGSSGTVGIGTKTPDRNLDIRHSNTGGGMEIDRSGSNIWSGLVYENDGEEKWFVGMKPDSNNLLFKSDTAGVSMLIEDETGNIGISTNNPSEKLDVDNGDIIVRGPDSFDSPGEQANVYVGSVHQYVRGEYGFGMKFGAYAANDALAIRELSGNVGIGTTTPGFPLTFPNTHGDKISLYGQSGDHYGFGIQPGLLQIHAAGSNDDIAFGFGGSANFKERVRFEGNGEVGLGTTIPDRNLDIYHSNSGGGIEIDRSLNSIWSGIVYENNGAENWFIGVQANSDDLLFKDNAAGISMLIEDGTGYVGIGTTDPDQMLEVAGYMMADRYIDGGNTSFYLDPAYISVCSHMQASIYSDYDDTFYYVDPDPGSISYTSARLRGKVYVYGAVEMVDVYNTNLTGKTVYVNSSGRLGSLSSSKRYKENIAPLQDDSSKILQARPVTFTWKESKERGFGLIAEDMDELGLTNLVVYDSEGRPDSVRYEFISLYLLEVAKEQAASIKELKAENESLKEQLRAENQSLKNRLAALEEMMRQQQFASGKEI
jgi:hypothetical protein